MKVAAFINGSMIAENTALYALHYAKELGYELELVHIENEKDNLKDVKISFSNIKVLALQEGVAFSEEILSGDEKKVIKEYVQASYVDTIFCSTRKRKRFFSDTFSEKITKMDLNVDIAIARIAKLNYSSELRSIILPINQAHLSVKKFTFFTTMAKAHKADAEIYSITTMSKNTLASIGISKIKNKLEDINFRLRHYMKLSRIMDLRLKIKHDFTLNEKDQIISRTEKSEHELIIIGARRFSFAEAIFLRKPIESILKETRTNTIAYYPYED